jgi:hypothetical protein
MAQPVRHELVLNGKLPFPPEAPSQGNAQGNAVALLKAEVLAKGITTVMVKNIAHICTQQELLDKLDRSGFRGTYDFCYLPRNFATKRNRGYAFINFFKVEVAACFAACWHKGRRISTSCRDQPLHVAVAAVQGRDANYRHACSPKMGRIKNTDFRPFVIMQDAAE